MRRRIGGINTGLGNPDDVLLDNEGDINQEFAKDAVEAYFKDYEGFDYQIHPDQISIGIEPNYQYDPLKIIAIHKDKAKSYYQTGKAWGGYGSQIAKKTRVYGQYKNKSKFVRFVDKWHAILFANQK